MYVDGFIIPVKKKDLDKYKKLAKTSAKIWTDYGATEYVECIGDDVPKGKITSFPRSVKLKAGEVVIFSWITYKSRAQRDSIMKKVMKDPRFDQYMNPKLLPFDAKRMIWGGFKPFINL